jgi:hypothetical protein
VEEFSDAGFHGLDVESQLGEAEVSSIQTRVTNRKGNNFRSDRCITLKIIEEFPDAVFLGVDMESLLGEADVSSRQTRVPVRKSYNF